ncbi:hypothetical protein [Bosea sp. (in: a-proteobacteria)]|uniref:hypothetical protein n=1 Tax=Bosea sp. (in: a-proteobacteria) TaxID=1871050 RepID=UPI00403378CA
MMKRAFAIIVVALIAAPALADGNAPPRFQLLTTAKSGALQLQLGEKAGRCTIRNAPSGPEQTLEIGAPCGFVRRSETAAAQSHSYSAAGSVFVIAGPPAPDAQYTAQGSVKPAFLCANEGQPVFVKNDAIRLGKPKQRALGFCHRLGFDEKDFYGFAHPID